MRSKGGYPQEDNFSFYRFAGTVWVTLKVAFGGLAFGVIYKLIGFKSTASIIGICALIVLVFAIAESKTPLVQIAKRALLIGFLILAIVFMYMASGLAVIGTLLGIAAVASPLLFTRSPRKSKEADMYIDPVYKGFSGNIWTDKNDG